MAECEQEWELELARRFILRERSRIRTWLRSRDILCAFLDEFHRREQLALRARASEILEVILSLNRQNANPTKLLFVGIIRTWYHYLYELGELLHPIHSRLIIKKKPRPLPAPHGRPGQHPRRHLHLLDMAWAYSPRLALASLVDLIFPLRHHLY